VRDVCVHFHPHKSLFSRAVAPNKAIDGVTCEISQGETLGLVGESGCGKSTLARVLIGLIRPTSGSVVFDGHDMHAASRRNMRGARRGIQMIFQDPAGSLNPRMRVRDIVAEPFIVHGLPWRDRIGPLLEKCGMPASCMDRFPHQFSGGQRQRIAIARALALEPKLVICDEPTSALDVSVQAQIINLLMDLQRELNTSYLFISHDIGVVSHVASRVAVMLAGKFTEIGPAESVLSAPTHPYTRRLLAAAGVGGVGELPAVESQVGAAP